MRKYSRNHGHYKITKGLQKRFFNNRFYLSPSSIFFVKKESVSPQPTPTPTPCHATSNLILDYDPSNINSYPGSGSLVYDLSENELVGTGSNLSYSNPYFTFNGSNSQIRISDNALLEPGSGDWTMEAWFRVTANQSGVILGKFDNGGGSQDVSYSIRINSGGSLFAQMGSGFAGSFVNSTFYQTTIGTWYQVVYVWKMLRQKHWKHI